MESLKEVLHKAQERKVAVGHFNVSDLVGVRAIVNAARALGLPIMLGVSEGEREFVGVRSIAALVKSLRAEYGHPIFLNADHTHTLDKAREAAEAGFDEIIFDASKLPFEENVAMTKRAVDMVKNINREILVEGEIGYIGSSSAILDKVPEGAALTSASYTTPEEAAQFVRGTGVDILAPAVGNMHGMLAQMVPMAKPSRIHDFVGTQKRTFKRLDIARVQAIAEAVKIPLTLHGGSGTAEEDFVAAIKAGITIVHINTEIRLAWRRGVEEGLAADKNEVAPYKILLPAVHAVQEIVKNRLKLFSGK